MNTRGYKGFNADLTCRPVTGVVTQYEVGKTQVAKRIALCERGLHFCKLPHHVLRYYNLATSRFGIIQAGDRVMSDELKSVTSRLKVLEELSWRDFIRACYDGIKKYVLSSAAAHKPSDGILISKADKAVLACSATEDYQHVIAMGNWPTVLNDSPYSKTVIAGPRQSVGGDIATGGHCSKLALMNSYMCAVNSGNNSSLVSTGDHVQIGNEGSAVSVATTGSESAIVSHGDYCVLTATASCSKIKSKGRDCIAAALGQGGWASGDIGTWLVLCEYGVNDVIKAVKAVRVDGKRIKANTFYRLINKKVEEVNV